MTLPRTASAMVWPARSLRRSTNTRRVSGPSLLLITLLVGFVVACEEPAPVTVFPTVVDDADVGSQPDAPDVRADTTVVPDVGDAALLDAVDADLEADVSEADATVPETTEPCEAGFVDVDGTCVDVDECADETDDCVSSRACQNTEGSYTCGDCPEGFETFGEWACVDVDECATGEAMCGPLRLCANTPGGYSCTTCPSGYLEDGPHDCVDIDECADGAGGCMNGRICQNEPGGYSCSECTTGYAEDGPFACVDIDECASPEINECGDLRACANEDGGYACANCPAGFIDDGPFECVDIDECLEGLAECDDLRTCSNTPGGYDCGDCPGGYHEFGPYDCVERNSCEEGTHRCEDGRPCIAGRLGTFECGPCAEGLVEDGSFECRDQNECTELPDACDEHRPCFNEHGGYSCGPCSNGFVNDGPRDCTPCPSTYGSRGGGTCFLPTVYGPVYGNSDGDPYAFVCSEGDALSHFETVYDDRSGGVTTLTAVCRPIEYHRDSGAVTFGGSMFGTSIGTIGAPRVFPSSSWSHRCDDDGPITSVQLDFTGQGRIGFLRSNCSALRRANTPSGDSVAFGYGGMTRTSGERSNMEPVVASCPQGFVAVGIHGRDNGLAQADSLGLVCRRVHLYMVTGSEEDCVAAETCHRVAELSDSGFTSTVGEPASLPSVDCPAGQVLGGMSAVVGPGGTLWDGIREVAAECRTIELNAEGEFRSREAATLFSQGTHGGGAQQQVYRYCPDGEVMSGLDVNIDDGALALRVNCASIVSTADGLLELMASSSTATFGGPFSGSTTTLTCPSGEVPAGIRTVVYRGLIEGIALRCRAVELDPSGVGH